MIYKKNINQDFFKTWTSEMSYVLGYVVADGCISASKDRKKNPFTFNITSVEKKHLYRIRKTLRSEHKISKKSTGKPGEIGYQLQIRNPILTKDLMGLGILPRKTQNLNFIKVPQIYFPDFVRGFFDGDGSVYIYKVNNTLQIKAGFVCVSFSFLIEFNKRLCKNLNIPIKSIHRTIDKQGKKKMDQFNTHFYIDDCEKLAQFMYKNNPTIYLPRKRKIFEKWRSIKRRPYLKKNYPSKIGWHLNHKIFA